MCIIYAGYITFTQWRTRHEQNCNIQRLSEIIVWEACVVCGFTGVRMHPAPQLLKTGFSSPPPPPPPLSKCQPLLSHSLGLFRAIKCQILQNIFFYDNARKLVIVIMWFNFVYILKLKYKIIKREAGFLVTFTEIRFTFPKTQFQSITTPQRQTKAF